GAPTAATRSRLTGYAFALAAGAIWGTTGPLSTALYAQGAQITAVGFWRIFLATAGFIIYGLFARDLFKVDRRGLMIIGVVGGVLVAFFEVGFQFAIAGLGVAPAVALLYVAPVAVAFLAHFMLGERLTGLRVALAVMVMIGVALTVNGTVSGEGTTLSASRFAGLIGGVLAAASYAGTTIMARYAVPRYGAVRTLFLELAGGTFILALLLPLVGHTPRVPDSISGWIYIAALGIGAVLAANFVFFAAVKRIDAAPTAIAASIEPLVGALLALLLFNQQLYWFGWLGLAMVIAGVSAGARE
ncbi:MAG: DMT family transporter, partial [Gemmatimonadota bacterium]